MLIVIGTLAAVLTLVWAMYTYYKPHPQQTEAPIVLQMESRRLSQSVRANVVNDAVVFLDWIQKNHNAYIHSYPSFVSIRPYLTVLQRDGFVSKSDVSNMQGEVFELTAEGQKALITAGLRLV
jgi:hypothetical protein